MSKAYRIPHGPTFKDLTGRRFGRLKVLHFIRTVVSNSYWQCACDCGATHIATSRHMVSGSTKSCGCLRREYWRKRWTTHGKTDLAEYNIWCGIKTRCTSPRSHAWPRYGGRGIRMCSRWIKSFPAFLADMGPRPAGHTCDRIDNDGDYKPSNCRWATRSQQARNTSANLRITLRGETHCAVEWAEKLGIKVGTIVNRVNLGMTPERILYPGMHKSGSAAGEAWYSARRDPAKVTR